MDFFMNFFIEKDGEALFTADTLDGERFRLSLERITQMAGGGGGDGRESQAHPLCAGTPALQFPADGGLDGGEQKVNSLCAGIPALSSSEDAGGDDEEPRVHPLYAEYFRSAARWILLLLSHRRMLEDGSFLRRSEEELAAMNRALYEDILPENYGESWANHAHASRRFGKKMGPVLSALFYELRCMIPLAYEGEAERFLTRMELLLEVHFAFVTAYAEYEADREGGGVPSPAHIREKIRQFLLDYAEEEVLVRARKNLVGGSLPEEVIRAFGNTCGKETRPASPAECFPRDVRCLYRYGAYISENERGVFSYLEGLDEETAARMADTWTEGFRIGFEVTGKDLSFRHRAGILYHIGFERIAARAAWNLGRMAGGLRAVMAGQQADLFTQHLGRGGGGIGTTSPNPQYDYDHREDLALFLNDVLYARRLESLRQAYESLGDEAAAYAGPLVMETFGEKPFIPEADPAAPRFSKAQQRRIASFRQAADLLYDKAVIGRERSFTIIAFPVPEITETNPVLCRPEKRASFDEIFRAVIEINTLDYMTYRDVQARMIEALNTAGSIRVIGRGKNRTDLTVRLQELPDPEKQTLFENCVADVNIPVGEVFTTPALKGTDGILHVTRVCINGLLFEDLFLTFKDGCVADYGCGGFEDPQDGRSFIEENILFHHETLPMGECAVGTNTTAGAMAARMGFMDRLPILIAEKTGPHFAVGDTCYSHEEENRVFNPDGKEIIAKENDFSLLRGTDPEKAYFGCHMDITIPYGEVGLFAAVRSDGEQIPLIRDGRFVLPGTEFLNAPLEELQVAP